VKRFVWLLLCVVAACISGLGCPGPDEPVTDKPSPTTKPAALSAAAKVPLAKLLPALERTSDSPDAEKLSERADGIVVRAEALARRGNYIQAITLFERAIGFDQNSPRLRRGLGLAYAALGDRAKAEPHLIASAKDAPDHVRVQLILGRYATTQRQFDQAIIRFRRALLCSDAADKNPDTAESLLRLGDLLERRGRWTASLECYERLGELIASHGRAYSSRPLLKSLVTSPERCIVAKGRLLLKLRQTDKAAVLLERAYRRDKTDPHAGRLAVIALTKTGEFDRARSIIMEMLVAPVRRRDATALAVMWCRAKKTPSAPKALLTQHLTSGKPNSEFVVAMAEVAAELGASDDAAEILTKYLSKASGDKVVTLRLARLYARTGNISAAVRQIASLLNVDACDTSQLREEVADLTRHGVKKGFADELSEDASKQGELKPAFLTVAAMLAENTGSREKGVALVLQAIEANEKFWPAYDVLADFYISGGEFAKIDALVAKAARLAGDGWFKFYFTGRIQLDRGCTAEAIDNLDRAHARCSRHIPTMYLLGRAFLRARLFRDAERYLLMAADLSPGHIKVSGELFNLYIAQRRNADAGRVVMRILQNNPKSVHARTLMGRFYFLTNRTKRARKILKSLLSEAPENVAVRLFELSFELSGPLPAGEPLQPDQAASALKKIRYILKLDPQNVVANRLCASLLVNQGKDAEAAKVWAVLHRRMPCDARTTSAWLGSLIKAGMDKQVAEAAEEIAGQKSATPTMRMAAMEAMLQIKQYERAERLIEQWMSEKPDKATLVRLRFQAMRVYETAEHYDKAQRLLDRWIASKPEPALLSSLRSEKIRIFGLAKQYDEAIASTKKWIRNEPGNPNPGNILIAVLIEAKQYDKAHAIVDEWLGAGGDAQMLDGLRAAKLILYAEQKQFDELVQFGRKWIGQTSNADRPFLLVIGLLSENEKYDRALKIAEDWLKHQEKLPQDAPKRAERIFSAKAEIVHVMLLAGKKKQALALARKYVQAEPQQIKALHILRTALVSMEREAEAMKVAQKIYKLDPDNPLINNDLGYALADKGIDLDKAETMIRKALAANPNSVAIRDSFGWVLYKQGRFAEAKTVFDGVLSTEAGKHPVMLDHAGDTCWRLGLKSEAIRLWEQAVEKAKKEKHPGTDEKKILAETPKKIKSVRKGRKPSVAPLGKGISAETADE
jgi:tetratricopeptide (TPR) repeat protein